MDDLVSEAKRISVNNNIIICFINLRYLPVAINWISFINKLNISNYLIVATDMQSYKELKRRGVNSVFVRGMGQKFSQGKFWLFRLKNIFKVLASGVNVIHSDSDAIWAKNPIPDFILQNKKYDIISSIAHKGNAHPPGVRKILGFTLCMGFIYFKSCKGTVEFLKKSINEFDKTDQKTINGLLVQNEMSITPEYGEGLLGSFIVDSNNLKVLALSKDIAIRDTVARTNSSDIYIYHPNSAKTCERTVKVLKKLNLWQV